MKQIFVPLLFAVLIGLSVQAAAKKSYTKAEVLSPEVAETVIGTASQLNDSYSLKVEDAEILAARYETGTKRQPQEVLLIWVKKAEGYELAHKMESGPGEIFSKPILFTANSFMFMNVSTEPNGSGGFVYDQFLWVAPDGSAHAIEFQQASEVYEKLVDSNEVILTGGEKEFFYQDDQMKFEFWVALEGDPHCCPSGGTVTGTYKLVGAPKYDSFTRRYQPNFQILVDHVDHQPATAQLLNQ